jgi:hypothetical protein
MYQPGQWLAIRRSAIEGVVVDQTAAEVTLVVFSPPSSAVRLGTVKVRCDPARGDLEPTEIWTLPLTDVFALLPGEPPHQPEDIDTLLTDEQAAELAQTAIDTYQQRKGSSDADADDST